MNFLIGNTPLIRIHYEYQGKPNYIYTKLEYYNVTGSIKDRIAYQMIDTAKKEGVLKKGMPIIEATSGNTGISFAAMGAYYKHPVIIFMPDWVSCERKKLMELYGAEVHLISKEEGGFEACIKKADKLAKDINGFRPQQFENEINTLTHYQTTAKEIETDLDEVPGRVISGIGTGGTLMGLGKYLKEIYPTIQVIAMEPEESPLITKGYTGNHELEGIGDDFLPRLVELDAIDDTILISSKDARKMAQKLASSLGLGVGITSGANVLASILTNGDKKSVTVCPDDAKKYLSTPLMKMDKTSSIVDEIILLNFEIVGTEKFTL
ncbi:MAG: cysteine synthase family protein [Firmicutes bacterium]|nr:cysteine synthase family protein [Bacillota bacterium]